MAWLRHYLQGIGIDAVWAVLIVAIGLAFFMASACGVALAKVQARLNRIPRDQLRKSHALVLSALCRVNPWLIFFIIFFSVLSGWQILGDSAPKYIGWLVGTMVMFQVGLVLDGIIKPILLENPYASGASSIGGIGLFLSRLLLWMVLILIILDNLGIKITALVAGLGVGGIAIALAVKSILEDIFASLTIALDKPFARGDSLELGGFSGTVENIGIKTTHVRSVNGELLIFSNSDLLQSRLRNFGRMRERRVLFVLGLTYETSAENIKKACKIIEEVITSHENARFDRAYFSVFNASSLDIEIAYWVRSPEFKIAVQLRQAINLEILERFGLAGIDFAYPTQRTITEPCTPLTKGSKDEPAN